MGREGLERDSFLIRFRQTADFSPPFCCLSEPDVRPWERVAPRRSAECSTRTTAPFVPRRRQSPDKCAIQEEPRPPDGGRTRWQIRSSPARSTRSDHSLARWPRLLDVSAGLGRDHDLGILGGRRGLRGKDRVFRETSRNWGRTRRSPRHSLLQRPKRLQRPAGLEQG